MAVRPRPHLFWRCVWSLGTRCSAAVLAGLMVSVSAASATETENLNMRVLPVPGKVVIDGACDDWDLSGGVFACGAVETSRDKFAVWIHAMYEFLGAWHFFPSFSLTNAKRCVIVALVAGVAA